MLFLLKCYWGGKFHVKILSSIVGKQKKRSGAPSVSHLRGLKRPTELKTGKNDKNFSIFDNGFSSLTMKCLVIYLATLI